MDLPDCLMTAGYGPCAGYEQLNSEFNRLRAELAVEQGKVKALRHQANEWADVACNAIPWLLNVRDGISTADKAVADMQAQIDRVRAMSSVENEVLQERKA